MKFLTAPVPKTEEPFVVTLVQDCADAVSVQVNRNVGLVNETTFTVARFSPANGGLVINKRYLRLMNIGLVLED